MRGLSRKAAVSSACLLGTELVLAQSGYSSKRGMSYIGDTPNSNYDVFLSSGSPVSWYFTWSPWPAPSDIFPEGAQSQIEFVPALQSVDNLEKDIERLRDLPDSSKHLFTFNEPDGTTDSGGTSIEPRDAAEAYINQIVPLREQFRISHPSVTGSPRGLEWLNDFNSSCWDIDPENGCPVDFVVAHWYGDFAGLASWLSQMEEWYSTSGSGLEGDLKVWMKEFGLVQADQDATFAMMNQTLPYLDGLDYLEKYAWFGVFQPDNANEWTGPGLSLFQNDGGLSELGAYYLGGESNGFEVGEQGQSSGGDGNDDGNDDNYGNGNDENTDDDANAASGLTGSVFALWIAVAVGCLWNL